VGGTHFPITVPAVTLLAAPHYARRIHAYKHACLKEAAALHVLLPKATSWGYATALLGKEGGRPPDTYDDFMEMIKLPTRDELLQHGGSHLEDKGQLST